MRVVKVKEIIVYKGHSVHTLQWVEQVYCREWEYGAYRPPREYQTRPRPSFLHAQEKKLAVQDGISTLSYKMFSQTCGTRFYLNLFVKYFISNLPYKMFFQTCHSRCYLKLAVQNVSFNLQYKILSQPCRTRCYINLVVQDLISILPYKMLALTCRTRFYLKLAVQDGVFNLH